MSKSMVSPMLEEVVFPIEEIYFKHEVFCNMMIEGGLWWFVVHL